MFDKFQRALLLAVGAVAVNDNCCTLYEDEIYSGTSVTLCYESQDYPSYFNISDYGIDGVGSIECGQSIGWDLCVLRCYYTECTGSISSDALADIPEDHKWVKLDYVYYPRPH